MTLRDLTNRQAYDLRRYCKMRFKKWLAIQSRRTTMVPISPEHAWNAGYNAGLIDGLATEVQPTKAR